MTPLPTLPPFCLCFWHKLDFFSCTGSVLPLPQKTLNFNQKEEKERIRKRDEEESKKEQKENTTKKKKEQGETDVGEQPEGTNA